MTSRAPTRLLASVLMLALASCGRTAPLVQDEDGEARDPDHDNATLRAAAMREWYTESKRPDHQIWPRDYRAFLLDAARAERVRWADLMPGSRSAGLIAGSKWVNLGPTEASQGPSDSGRITAIIPDGTRMFVATAGGGVWKHQGSSWTPLTETIGTLSTGALAMDPSNHDRLYLGLGDAFDGTGVGLLVSNDAGATWSDPILLGDSMVTLSIAVEAASPNIVLVATDKGLFRSTNAGVSFDPVTINTGLASGPYVWSIAPTGAHSFALSLGQQPVDSEDTTDGQIWWSADDGATWTKATGVTAASGVGRITIASAPSNRATLYAMAAVPGATDSNDLADLFRSTDGGKSWTALNVGNKSYTNGTGQDGTLSGLLNGQGYYNQVVMVDPTNANTAYFGGALLLAKTTDGGSTFKALTDWTGQSRPYVHADFHAGAVDASGLYVGTDGGIFNSTDGGASFSDALNVGLATHLVYFIGSSAAAPSAVIGGMQDNGTRLRAGTTSAFDDQLGGDGFGVAINRTNGQKMLGSIYYDAIYSTTNGGGSWKRATSGIAEANNSNSAPFVTRIFTLEGPSSTGNEVYTYSNTKVYKSTNFGGTWVALPSAPVSGQTIIRNIGVAAKDPKIIGVVASGGGVLLSKDGGSTWTTLANGKGSDPSALPNSDRSMSSIEFDVSDPNTVYVSSVAPEASVNHLWKSTDLGAHWTALDGTGLPAGVPINVIKTDPVPGTTPGQVVYAGTHLGVYRSVDGGATWARFGVGLPLCNVTDLYVSPDESIVRAATFGRGFWELVAAANDFSINDDPSSLAIAQGASASTTIHSTVIAGSAETIDFAVTGLPSGVSGSFAPASLTAGADTVLTLTADATAAPGTYPVTITGTSPSAGHALGLSVTIAAPGDFSIAVTPDNVHADPGASATASVTTAIVSGAAQPIDLSVAGLPDGATAMFDMTSVTAGGGATLTIATAATTPDGTYALTITGTGPSAAHTATLTLVVGNGGPGETGNHGGCCSAGGSREAAGNALLALGVIVLARRRRRRTA